MTWFSAEKEEIEEKRSIVRQQLKKLELKKVAIEQSERSSQLQLLGEERLNVRRLYFITNNQFQSRY